MADLIIRYSFYLLFFLTPLFWTSYNYELFEFNKMLFTYGITVIIIGAWVLKTINDKRLTINRTPLDIPLLLFLGANILSTIFSIDIHTSISGYYSRLNGGLISTISYLLLYFAFVSNFPKEKIKNLFMSAFAGGFLISLWAILEHFGISFSCIILRGEFNADCWVQDVQARVFASLGQPNWLAGYLAMLIFPALYFFLTAKNKFQFFTFYFLLFTFYLAFTFTYSRGPTLGLIGGLAIFLLSYLSFWKPKADKQSLRSNELRILNIDPITRFARSRMTILLASFLVINILFGSALTTFRLVSKFAAPPRPTIALPPTSVTQLENGGTESGQIRFIVWQGALDIFKHYPLLGSGVETFAYSYYQFRPAEHNQTSEWDFLYNKAHNEYLNYLATTGLVGFTSYMIVILTFVIWSIKRIMNHESRIKEKNHNSYFILHASILAAYISYLIYNFFLFSVVILALFFFLFPAIAFVATESQKGFRVKGIGFSWIYKRPIYTKFAKGIIITSILYTLYSILSVWYADTLFAKGDRASDNGNPGRAYNLISGAVDLNKNEPLYRSELAFNAALSALALEGTDATLSAELVEEADIQMEYTLLKNPKNISLWRTAIRTFFTLASLDKKYSAKTLEAVEKSIELAPTDPKLFYNKAKILFDLDKKDEAIEAITIALKLKPDYIEAKDQLAKWEEATRSAKTR